MVNLGEKLKALRLEKSMTQTDVASRIGVSKSMISLYELEERAPSYEILIKIAALFGVTADYLLGIEKSPTISVEGLNDMEIGVIMHMIDVLRGR